MTRRFGPSELCRQCVWHNCPPESINSIITTPRLFSVVSQYGFGDKEREAARKERDWINQRFQKMNAQVQKMYLFMCMCVIAVAGLRGGRGGVVIEEARVRKGDDASRRQPIEPSVGVEKRRQATRARAANDDVGCHFEATLPQFGPLDLANTAHAFMELGEPVGGRQGRRQGRSQRRC